MIEIYCKLHSSSLLWQKVFFCFLCRGFFRSSLDHRHVYLGPDGQERHGLSMSLSPWKAVQANQDQDHPTRLSSSSSSGITFYLQWGCIAGLHVYIYDFMTLWLYMTKVEVAKSNSKIFENLWACSKTQCGSCKKGGRPNWSGWGAALEHPGELINPPEPLHPLLLLLFHSTQLLLLM